MPLLVFFIFSLLKKSENKGRTRSTWKWGRGDGVIGGEKR
jgi:hypothetical protein